MILDRIENLSRYTALSERIGQVQAFLEGCEAEKLPAGRLEIDGDRLYVLVQDRVLGEGEPKFETHARYADLQLMVRGKAGYGWSSDTEIGSMDPVKDIAFGPARQEAAPVLTDGMFVVYLPGEAHAPDIFEGEKNIRKLVFKMLWT